MCSQTGAQGHDVYKATAPYGLHFNVGHSSSVGIGGYVLMGGHGWGSTAFGPACENVLAFRVVNETGVYSVTAASDLDLFWGLKGAGQWLAVVLDITVRLHPLPPMLRTSQTASGFPDAQEVSAWWADWQARAPNPIESFLIFVGESESVRDVGLARAGCWAATSGHWSTLVNAG
ncbi:hypothetical protein WJX72_008644 [[Myrmecia] bisecta]|uniref:FAD-binding PCMH-type domain-containing protein n=1 Tax=[Myrmecia] bisecta TaxID=41462 RepID=A0AAW1PTX9_9CHLO